MKTVNQKELAETIGITARQVRNLVKKGVLQPNDSGKFSVLDSLKRYSMYKEGIPFRTEIKLTDEEETETLRNQLETFFNGIEDHYKIEDFNVSESLKKTFSDNLVSANTANLTLRDVANDILKITQRSKYSEVIEIFNKHLFDRELMEETLAWMEEEALS